MGPACHGAFAQDTVPKAKTLLDDSLRMLFTEGDTGKAKAFLLDALHSDPGYKPAMFNLGYIYAMEENIPEARRYLTMYVNAGGSSKHLAEAQKQLAELEHLEKIKSDPKLYQERTYTVLILRAVDFDAMGLPREALAICEKAAKAQPNRFEAYAQASRICTQSGLIDSASRFLDKAIAVAPPVDRFGLMQERYLIQNADEEQKLRSDVALSIKAGDFKTAEQDLRALCANHPDDKRLKTELATVFMYSGQEPSARKVLIPLAGDTGDPIAAKKAAALLKKMDEVDEYRKMLADHTIRHPKLQEVEDNMRRLAQEIGLNAQDAQDLDQLAAQYDQLRVNDVTNGLQQPAAVAGIAGLFSAIGANNRKNEVENKKEELKKLAGERTRLIALPRPYVVGISAFDDGNYGVAEIGFAGTPSRDRDGEYSYRYAQLKLAEGQPKQAGELLSECQGYISSQPLTEQSKVSSMFMQLANYEGASRLFVSSEDSVLGRNDFHDSALTICRNGVHALLLLKDYKTASNLGERAWKRFERPPIGYDASEAFLHLALPARAVQILESVHGSQLKEKSAPSDLGITEVKLASALLDQGNLKSAKAMGLLARQHGVNDPKLFERLGLQ